MALTTLRQILDHAASHDYGVPAFNITNLETLHAVMLAADDTKSPVILQASQSARKYMGDVFLKHMISAVLEQYPALPVCIHQDHGSSVAVCEAAMNLGFSSVMMDGSLLEDGKTPASYDENVGVTVATVRKAHARGVSVEGEIGVLGSLETGAGEKEDGHGFEGTLERAELLTNPVQAAEFVAATGVDALAVAIGTSHGAYKFSRRPTGDILALETIERIHERLPSTHLVMHGASTIPEDLQQLINEAGGNVPTTFGVPLEEVERGIRSGVRKINIDTDIRMAMTGSMRKYLQDNRSSFDIRALQKSGIERTRALCRERFERFGCAGHGPRFQSISLAGMAERYRSNAL